MDKNVDALFQEYWGKDGRTDGTFSFKDYKQAAYHAFYAGWKKRKESERRLSDMTDYNEKDAEEYISKITGEPK